MKLLKVPLLSSNNNLSGRVERGRFINQSLDDAIFKNLMVIQMDDIQLGKETRLSTLDLGDTEYLDNK